MALIPQCPLCNKRVARDHPGIGFPHFIHEKSDPLWKFSERMFHFECLEVWKDRDRFLSLWFDAQKFFRDPFKRNILWESNNIFVCGGGQQISICIRFYVPTLGFQKEEAKQFTLWLLDSHHTEALRLISPDNKSEQITYTKNIKGRTVILGINIPSWYNFTWKISKEISSELELGINQAICVLEEKEVARVGKNC